MSAHGQIPTARNAAFNLAEAPMAIGTVTLRVRDLDQIGRYYREVVGLRTIDVAENTHLLGAGDRALLELRSDPAAVPRDPGAAGLFHTAFLLPERADLGRWLARALDRRIPLAGASDHRVSEAVYLNDPEGNGIEIYADRPPATWPYRDGYLNMSTDPLDIDGLVAAGKGGAWDGIPAGGIVGHVHLQVGDTALAERFYGGVLGFEVTCRYPGASFFGAGGYHHQLAGNIWNSRGAGRRDDSATGLAGLGIDVRDAELLTAIETRAREAGAELRAEDGGLVVEDPWGIPVIMKTAH